MEVPTADDIWDAASLKGRFPIAYTDAFAAALAQKFACPLVTGDPEFQSVDALELDWIGTSRRQIAGPFPRRSQNRFRMPTIL